MQKRILLALLYLFIISLLFSCSEKLNIDPTKTIKSSEKTILKFSFQNLTPAAQGTIDDASKKIKINVPISTNITSLTPSIVISKNATIDPDSGKVQNFTNPVIYTVTAEDKSAQQYSVEVTKQMTSNGIIFFADLGGKVFGIDIVTGKQVWEWKATSAINNTEIGGSPLIENDVLYCSFGGVLCAVDIKTKKIQMGD